MRQDGGYVNWGEVASRLQASLEQLILLQERRHLLAWVGLQRDGRREVLGLLGPQLVRDALLER